ncbi:MAG TPA: type II/IV secretion system protein [Candidatus Pacebacteria bacterium]|nr:type II/IV secretion system protein [Candidatus Paceibacterota bacterium]
MNITFNDDTPQMQRLKKLKIKSEERLVKTFAKSAGVKYVDLSLKSINTDALKLIPEVRSREAHMVVFDMKDRDLDIAVRSTLPQKTQEEIQKLKDKKYNITIYMASARSIDKAWSRYGDISYAVVTERGVIDLSSADIQDVLEQVKTLEDAKIILSEAINSNKSYRISKIIELFLYAAYALGASDIHIETSEDGARVRFRMDGILTEVANFDMQTFGRILNRIKLTAGLKISIKENSQDGRFTIRLADLELEIRTSTLPDAYGESVVMRLLDPKAISVPMEKLGFLPYFQDIVTREIDKPNGMVINTGPTGSGKSTTLFALLRKLIKPENKILTIENPIEYHVKGITQSQVNIEKGFTFLSGLRAALRQDPDIIMVGEIRDGETASIAVNAALTGHLVFSTLHTNSAAGAFPRFMELGVNPKILATAMNMIIAQRLVRKLCPFCKVQVNAADEKNTKQMENIVKIYSGIENKERFIDTSVEHKIFKAVGCEKCNGTGFKGRIAVVEGVIMDEKLEILLASEPTEREIVANTRHQGILSLKQDAVIKIVSGMTSYDEVLRVVEL